MFLSKVFIIGCGVVICPVEARASGPKNVLLTEVAMPYKIPNEIEDINPRF
jgi:NAD/NADP transhydrogenase beta subunit